jgi:uncharacterized protein (TIGR00369 family)
MDELTAKNAFEFALRTHKPGFGTFFLARLFGLDISYTEETCVVEVDVKDFMFNPQGTLHGGVLALILDISMGHFINHSTGAPGMTLEMKTQFMRPVGAGRIRCEGRFLKRGRRLSFMEARLTGSDGKLAAMATATWQMPQSTED